MSTNKRYGPHNQMLISFLIGSLLGDGQARKGYNTKSGKGTIFTFSQGEKNKEYLLWQYDFLKKHGLCSDTFPKKGNINNTSKFKYNFYTIKHTTLDFMFDAFYKSKTTSNGYIKGIYNKDYIFNNFNELSLAIWLMDDGTKQGKHIKFCTDNFTKEDVVFLQNILKIKFNLNTTTHFAGNYDKEGNIKYNQYRIYIKANSMTKLIDIITPYIHSSMLYKINFK
jgi:hypothetical protein